MRDSSRIDHVLGVIKRAWQQEPDLRLCQLLSNAVGMATHQETTDCFYTEDDVLLQGLELYIEEIFRSAVAKRAEQASPSEPDKVG